MKLVSNPLPLPLSIPRVSLFFIKGMRFMGKTGHGPQDTHQFVPVFCGRRRPKPPFVKRAHLVPRMMKPGELKACERLY
jgi:hypothetical protein